MNVNRTRGPLLSPPTRPPALPPRRGGRLTQPSPTCLRALLSWAFGSFLSAGAQLPPPAPPTLPPSLSEWVITPYRTGQPIDRLGLSVTLLPGSRLQAEQETFLAPALQAAPGVYLHRAGATGAATTLNLRGHRTQDALLRVDGAKVSGGVITGLVPFLAHAQSWNLERAEIVTGPQSLLYGSDTLGGVVSLQTRRGSGPATLTTRVEGGSFATLQGGLSGAGQAGRLDWSFHTAAFTTENDRPGNAYDNRDYSLRLDYRLSPDWEIGFASRGHRSDYEDPPNPALAIGEARVLNTNSAFSAWVAGRPSSAWTTRLTATTGLEDYDADFSGFAYLSDSTLSHLEWENLWQASPQFRLVAGASAEFARQKDNFFPSGYEESFHSGLFAQGIWEPAPDWSLVAGLRHDWVDRFEDPLTARASLAWTPGGGSFRLWLAGGSAFRAPNVYQLFSSYGGGGNAALRPEEGRSLEAGLSTPLSGRWGRLTTVLFLSRTDDLIVDADPDPAILRPENRDEAESSGLETAWQAQLLPALSVRAAWTWLESDATASPAGTTSPPESQRRLNLPRHQVDATAVWTPHSRFELGLGLHALGARLGNYAPFFSPPDIRSDSFLVTRLFSSWQPIPSLRLTARLENLLNTTYDAAPGYPAPGFGGFLGLQWTWSVSP